MSLKSYNIFLIRPICVAMAIYNTSSFVVTLGLDAMTARSVYWNFWMSADIASKRKFTDFADLAWYLALDDSSLGARRMDRECNLLTNRAAVWSMLTIGYDDAVIQDLAMLPSSCTLQLDFLPILSWLKFWYSWLSGLDVKVGCVVLLPWKCRDFRTAMWPAADYVFSTCVRRHASAADSIHTK